MREQSSFRDPNSHVFQFGNQIFRGLKGPTVARTQSFLDSQLFQKWNGGALVRTQSLKKSELTTVPKKILGQYDLWLEHEKIELITYPAEWTFGNLKRAGVFYLDLCIEALDHGYIFKDASAYNIQFVGSKPVFIDLPSIEPYTEGEPWIAYKQFCEQFLAPLAINSFAGIEHNQFFRGNVDGLDLKTATRILPLGSYFSPTLLGHLHVHAWALNKATSEKFKQKKPQIKSIPSNQLRAMFHSLRKFLNRLQPKERTYWSAYSECNSYSSSTEQNKHEQVHEFCSRLAGTNLIDLGCNSGEFSLTASRAGMKNIIGIDIDGGALDAAYSRMRASESRFCGLQLDALNPTPATGWRNTERSVIWDRISKSDGVICLALIHHICIGRNVPIDMFLDLLFSLSDRILIEFVPKEDPMCQGLLAHREDVFHDYSINHFQKALENRASIINVSPLVDSGRVLFEGQLNPEY